MLEILVKYSILMCCGFYVLLKLFHFKAKRSVYFKFLLLLLIALPIIYLLRLYVPTLSIIFMVSVFFIVSIKTIKVPIDICFSTSVVAVGIAYIVLVLAAIIGISCYYIIVSLLHSKIQFNWVPVLISSFVQILLTFTLFRIKRLRNSMPFVIERGSREIFVYISTILLFAASFLGINKNTELIFLIPSFFAAVVSLTILFWWRNSITKKYLEKVKAQELQELQNTIDNQSTDIANLRAHNDELSKIIHKDNKLIPALEYAVRQYFLTTDSESDRDTRIEKAKVLLSQIEEVSRERRGIISSYELNSKTLPLTNVASIDSLLLYMLQKSKDYQVDFNITITGSVKYLVENLVEELDANTLLADLIENAFIATKKCSLKNVMVHLGISNEHYSIDVFDNGIPFSPEIIARIGLSRVTTHENEGGTGIGLMTTFEILQKYQASFEIEEIQDGSLFTKRVTVCFNSLGQFQIKTGCDNKTENINDRECV